MNKYKFKGTPTPWHAVDYAGFFSIQYQDGYSPTDVFSYDHVEIDGIDKSIITKDMAEANSHLAAAAPDLLEACKKALEELELTNAYHPLRLKLKTAIHKALNIQE